MGKYLSIATGYRKVETPVNRDKVEIRLTPRFLVDKQMPQLAPKHYLREVRNWNAAEAPIGIFWTWGGWDAHRMTCCNHLTTESMEVSSENLLGKYGKSARRGEAGASAEIVGEGVRTPLQFRISFVN
jgi:hypothetical protein